MASGPSDLRPAVGRAPEVARARPMAPRDRQPEQKEDRCPEADKTPDSAVLGRCGAAGAIGRMESNGDVHPSNHGTSLESAAAILAVLCLHRVEWPSEELLDGRDAFSSQTWPDICREPRRQLRRVAKTFGAAM